ncbi:hypothetical protein MNBD_GAMMA09-1925 [hydrothermal vent metagenome]|uniref:ABC-type transport auxiliary lipoprotein component domain-containing protein n=1 Tax=hydrothermal vent metagenome TaxID=652676 RepID=A0A3B0Y458_9ZZZZ
MYRVLIIVGLISILVACGSSPKTHFYILNGEAGYDFSDRSDKNVRIGIWKVKLPELVDRAEIVTRIDQNNIELADFHQWAGGLSNNITQLLANELSRQLKTERVVISPWSSYRKNDFQVKIHISRFDGKLAGESVLSGAWSLLNAEGSKEVIREAFNYKLMAESDSYSEMVKTQSKLVVQLAEQISEVILAQKNSSK